MRERLGVAGCAHPSDGSSRKPSGVAARASEFWAADTQGTSALGSQAGSSGRDVRSASEGRRGCGLGRRAVRASVEGLKMASRQEAIALLVGAVGGVALTLLVQNSLKSSRGYGRDAGGSETGGQETATTTTGKEEKGAQAGPKGPKGPPPKNKRKPCQGSFLSEEYGTSPPGGGLWVCIESNEPRVVYLYVIHTHIHTHTHTHTHLY